jgi:hypothetical protein
MYFFYLAIVYNIFKLCNCFALFLMLFILLILLNKEAKNFFICISACILRAIFELQVLYPSNVIVMLLMTVTGCGRCMLGPMHDRSCFRTTRAPSRRRRSISVYVVVARKYHLLLLLLFLRYCGCVRSSIR